MKMIQHTLLAIVLLCTAGATFAQPNNTATGRLGVRYIETNFQVSDGKSTVTDSYGSGFGINLPIKSWLDVGLDYGYGWLKKNPFVTSSAHGLAATATYYTDLDGLRPFVSARIGHARFKTSAAGQTSRINSDSYDLMIGFETSVGPIILTPTIAHGDSFDNSGEGGFNFAVGAHYWITSKIGVRSDISYSDYGSGGLSEMSYGVGLALKF
jgi:opacity protein-like surface antigen